MSPRTISIKLTVTVPDDIWEHGHKDVLYTQVGYGVITAITAALSPGNEDYEATMLAGLQGEGTAIEITQNTPAAEQEFWGNKEDLPQNWHPTANKFLVWQGMPAEWGEGSATPIYHTLEHGVDCYM